MFKWFTSSCNETKKVLRWNYECCNSCHEDVRDGYDDCIEKCSPNEDLLFYACCGFPELNKEEWIKFERKLKGHKKRKDRRKK